MNLEDAETLGAQFMDLLVGTTQRMEFAGGIRRLKENPHDIEVVAIPKYRKPAGSAINARIAKPQHGSQRAPRYLKFSVTPARLVRMRRWQARCQSKGSMSARMRLCLRVSTQP